MGLDDICLEEWILMNKDLPADKRQELCVTKERIEWAKRQLSNTSHRRCIDLNKA